MFRRPILLSKRNAELIEAKATKLADTAFAVGFNSGVEAAARVAEMYLGAAGPGIAARIRALRP